MESVLLLVKFRPSIKIGLTYVMEEMMKPRVILNLDKITKSDTDSDQNLPIKNLG